MNSLTSTHARILDAAGAEIVERRSADLSPDRVAERAGLTRSAVLQHFGSPELFLETVVQYFAEKAGHSRVAAAYALDPPVRALSDGLRTGCELWANSADLCRVLWGLKAVDDTVAGRVGAADDFRRGMVTDLVRRLAGSGALDSEDISGAVDALSTLTSFAAYDQLASFGHGPAEVAKLLERSFSGWLTTPIA